MAANGVKLLIARNGCPGADCRGFLVARMLPVLARAG